MAEIQLHEETLTLTGDEKMDSGACRECEKEFSEKLESAKSVVFQMDQVNFVASAFLRLCIEAVKTVGPGNVVLEKVNPMVRKVIKMTGLDDQVTMT